MQKTTRWLYILALVKFVLPYLLQNGAYEPHRDEFLYLIEGNHMSFGFMEVPPLLSVFAWLTNLFGGSMFWIKVWPSLFGALTFLLAGKILLSVGGRLFSLFLLFCCFVFGAYLRVHFLFQPNFLEIFFYTAIAFGLIRYLQRGSNRWLYFTGVSMGLGMLSKYSVAFYILAILLAFLFSPERAIYRNRHWYFALFAGFLIFLPNGIWQALHHFPVIWHMNELQKTQLQYVHPKAFVWDQFLMLLPCCFIWVAGVLYLSFTRSGTKYRFVARAFIFVLYLLLQFHGKSYYALGLYPVLCAFGAYAIERATARRFTILRYAVVVFILLMGLYIVPILMPVLPPAELASLLDKMKGPKKSGALKWEDLENHPLPQDFADMLGWREMARKMGAAYATLDSNEKKRTILFCDNYGMAGAVNYYRKDYGLPEAYSDNASFLYWIPDSLSFDHLLLMTDDQQEMQHDFIKEFGSANLYDSTTTPFSRERGDLIILLKNARPSFQVFMRDKLRKDKEKLNE